MRRTTPKRVRGYAGGRPYRGLYATYSGEYRPRDCGMQAAVGFPSACADWAHFWELVSGQLDQHAYSPRTQQLYRSVLRGFYRHVGERPVAVHAGTIRAYVDHLVREHSSWSWLAMNISVLRTVFDKFGARDLTRDLVTPKRPLRLPEILSPGEARDILAAATSTRDQLILGLLYGCGLKVGELCRLRWGDVDLEENALLVRFARGTKVRWLDLPPELIPVLTAGVERCPTPGYIFQGRADGTHLSTRTVELTVRRAVGTTVTHKTVTAMTLRHSFAVHALESGDSVRAVQEALGHACIDATLHYERCILPHIASPLAIIRQLQSRESCPPCSIPPPVAHSPLDDEAHAPAPTAMLFLHPPSIEHLDLPFKDPESDRTPCSFSHLLRTHILGRFLCHRRATIRAG